jgi:hypothetical protein
MSKVIIDGDIVAYRMAFANKDKPLKIALIEVDTFMSYILSETSFYTNSGEYKVYLTGKGNFREEIAKTAVYKGNRKDAEKPVWLSAIRDHLVEAWDAEISCGQEADDLIAIEATKLGNRSVVASADKDMLQIPAFHFKVLSSSTPRSLQVMQLITSKAYTELVLRKLRKYLRVWLKKKTFGMPF